MKKEKLNLLKVLPDSSNLNFLEGNSLRQKAEELLKNRHSDKASPFIGFEREQLIHELEVCKLEIDLQNEALQLVTNKAATANKLYDFAPAGYFTLNREGAIRELNLSGARMLGKKRSDLVNTNFKLFITQDTLPIFNDFFQKLFETNFKVTCEVMLAVEGNPSLFVKIEGVISEDQQNCLVTAADITEHKWAEEALKESEAKYKSIIENLTDIYYRADADGKLIMINPSGLETFGYSSAEEIIGRSLELVYKNHDERAEFVALLRKNGKVRNYRTTLTRKDGAELYVETTATILFDRIGNYAGVEGIVRDITDRKRAEEALIVQNKELQLAINKAATATTLYDFAPAGYFTLNQDGVICEMNLNGANLLGNERSLLINSSFTQFVTRDTLPIFNEFLQRIFATNLKQTCEVSLSIQENPSSFVFLQGVVSKDEQKCLVAAINITDRKLMEEALRESEFFFRESQRAAFIGSYKVDLITGLWESSEVLDQIFGLDKSYNRVINEGWLDIIHPDDREEIDRSLNEDVIPKRRPFNKEYRIIRRSDGEIRWVIGLGKVVFDVEGNVTSLIGTIQDITERKQVEEKLQESEERFRSFVENANDIIYSLTLDGTFSYVSPNWTEILGHDVREVVGQFFGNFVHQEDIQRCREFLERAILSGEKQSGIEYRVRHKNGTWRWHLTNASPIHSTDGKLITFMGIARDISESKQVEEKLLHLNLQLKELNATKDKLFSIIAHDLKGPFNGILGYSELILENLRSYDKKKIEKFASQINSITNHTLDLLENLLDWTKTQTGQINFNPENLHLGVIIQDVFDVLDSSAKIKNISLNNSQVEGIIAFADQNMLKTILRNLISNSIKFTKSSGRIDVSAIADLNQLEITIKDNGVGMSKETQSKLFQLEANFTTNGTANEKGTGLGLILCKEFIEKHSGRIWVESEVGKGSTFHFTLPMYME